MKEIRKKIYILDTSALLSYIEDEEGSDIVENLLIEAENKKNSNMDCLCKLDGGVLYYPARKG